MKLTTVWQETIDRAILPPPTPLPAVPRQPAYYKDRLTFVDDGIGATAMLQLARELPLMCVGIDTEFGYLSAPVGLPSNKTVTDIRGTKPLLLSLTLAAHPPAGNGDIDIHEFVVDLRAQATHTAVAALLQLPVTFVGHFLQADYFCLLAAGLPIPERVWDTWVAEKVQHLGRHHAKYKLPIDPDEMAEAKAKEEAEQEEKLRLDLVDTCRRHGVEHLFAVADKERLQRSFLNHGDGAVFSDEQQRYAASDATAAAQIYLPQVKAAVLAGTHNHLITVEMPWIKVNAAMRWYGVRVDANAQQLLRDACDRILPRLRDELQAMGVANHRSHEQLKAFFGTKGLLDLFRRGDGYSFNKNRLKDMRHLEEAIGRIYELRKIESLGQDAILTPALVSANDGRMHPQHRHLGTASGRQSASLPNVLGLDRTLKPLIIPADGYGIGEVDLCQIEIGVAAAVYGDRQLIEMFNDGDVYSKMAQRFFADELNAASRGMDDVKFKQAHGGLRDIMKTCTLGIIYGLTPHGLAPRLKKTVPEAEAILGDFMNMFPVLKQALDETWQAGARRGYAETATGLRRYRKADGPMSAWEKNWMRNHPVQGSAAAAFKLAGIRLNGLYPKSGAKLILAVHDAYVFEAPLDAVKSVAELTRTVMCDAVQELFPVLRPRAEINISCPTCWSKDGDGQALGRWVAAAGRTSH